MFDSFYLKQKLENKKLYSRLILGVAQTSRLYSESDKPLIHYRAAENIFCKAFGAENVSRGDVSVDAVKRNDGLGIKTFVSGAEPKAEKIAEFNDEKKYQLIYTDHVKLINQVIYYRNKRIEATSKEFSLENNVYHYLVRESGKILVCECPMRTIDDNKIQMLPSTKRSPHIVRFRDDNGDYYFHITKNTLYHYFSYKQPFEIIVVPRRIDYELLSETMEIMTEEKVKNEKSLQKSKEYVVLPLYSTSTGDVPEKSGINGWNAGGRPRDLDEIYISIPMAVHKNKPRFFPPKDIKFKLITEDGQSFSAKVCQQNSKALMTDPNKALGKWLLRDILGLEKGILATYEHLRMKGADTVVIYKLDDDEYLIALHSFGGYDREYGKKVGK